MIEFWLFIKGETTVSFIEVISIPLGFAPERIRRMWVGIKIPLLTDEEMKLVPPRESTGPIAGGYLVSGCAAVEALKAAGKHDAASFWCRPLPPRYLEFKKEVCKLLEE